MSQSPFPNSIISHYRILSKIGEGGMGEVYLAEDIKLDRKVALKILPLEFAKDMERMNRFVREAKSASALNHPNILTIYEIDETESGHFIATEFINGETVRERARRTSITLSEALDIATQTASALAAAHHAGVVHRDIKPENVMVRKDGLVKVLDFGLAKVTASGVSDSEGETRIHSDTQPGMIMGTVAYMSPEQARGKAVDQRTDVWSLGVLLYEMLTRRTPFLGETSSDTLANILHREPDLLNTGALSNDLTRIVGSMLAKKLEARYQTMADALSDLKRLQRRIEFDSELQQTVLRSSAEAHTEVIASAIASSQTAADSASARTQEGFWVAVLPFKPSGKSSEVETLAKGLTEEIVIGLSRFSYLRVIARGSTVKYSDESGDVREIGKQLGARYVMEGSIRQAGTTIRLAVQLVDASTGAHLWANTYDRQFQPDQIFAVQDELVPRIVSTCADHFGVLARSISDAVRRKEIGELTPYEALMRGFGYHYRLSSEEHAEARQILEKAVAEAPSNADCWSMLSWTYSHEYGHGFNPQPDPLDRALAAARRAVDLAPSNHLAYQTLAVALFFRKDKAGCLSAAERAIALNPLDASNEAIFLITFLGDWERGCSLIRRAMDLNPYVPGWYRLILALNEYRKANYREALDEVIKANVRGTWADLVLSAIYGQLGEQVVARNAVQNLIAENFGESAREMLGKWFDAELVEHLVDGLRKAGLEIQSDPGTASPAGTASGERPALEGFWIAVLPFKFTGSNTEVATLAEGLSEEIVTGLSRFSYLRVISRSSTLRYAETSDVRTVGKTLGARYVLEGSLRVAGSSLRVSVQLVDAGTDAHLWAETYDRQFRAEELFALQDDLVPRIVSTIADVNGVLPRSMSEVVCARNPDELSPYEAVLRSFRYFDRVTAEELGAARACLEIAVQKAPANADAWAMLALLFVQDYGQGFNLHPDALNSGAMAAQRAVEAGPSNHLAHFSLAQARFFQKEPQSFRNAAERAVALNPMDANSLAFIGELFTYLGDSERGMALASRAKQINPNHPGWFWYADFFHAYRQGGYRDALNLILKTNLPGHWGMHAGIAAAAGQLGDYQTARKAVRDLLKLRPDYGATVHDTLAKWFDPELCEQLLDGLRKAGLEISEPEKSTTSSTVAETAESSPSIAVLPFVNISNDPDYDFFCDGLAEELLNALSKIDGLKVAARTSAFSFKGKNANVSDIGQKLGVKNVLEGSVRKSGNRVRITTQLINATDGYHLWSERYDREMNDIFDVQDEITVAVVDALRIKLLGEAKAAVLKRHTQNPEAYEFYLRGLSYFNRFTPDDFQTASENFLQAIAIDPLYALAYAGLADAYSELSFFSFSGEWMPKAKEAANKALELDDKLGEAHNSLGIINMYFDWEYAGAEQELKRAIALNPGSAPIHMWYGWYLGLMGRFDESLKEIQRAQELDPLSATINSGLGIVFHWSRQPDRAIQQFRKVLELNPNYHIALSFLAEAYEQKGDFVSAIETIEKVPQAGTDPLTLSTMGYMYARSGDRHKALGILNEFVERSKQEYVPAFNLAQIYAGLDDNEQALEWIEKACDERAVWMPFLKVDLKFASLRSDPRFQDVLRKVGFPQ